VTLPERSTVTRWFLWANVALLAAALVGWPLSQLTVARGEPPFILGLSWLAIVMSCWGNLLTATVKSDVQ
jgi:hypothetical protein